MLRAGAPAPNNISIATSSPGLGRRAPPRPTVERMVPCSPVTFNDIKHLARSMPADGLEAQDVVPDHFRCGDRFLGKAHARAIIRDYPEHEREARTRGVPTMGSGRIFTTSEDKLLVEPFDI